MLIATENDMIQNTIGSANQNIDAGNIDSNTKQKLQSQIDDLQKKLKNNKNSLEKIQKDMLEDKNENKLSDTLDAFDANLDTIEKQ